MSGQKTAGVGVKFLAINLSAFELVLYAVLEARTTTHLRLWLLPS